MPVSDLESGESWSLGELLSLGGKLAAALASAEVPPRPTVVVSLPSGPAFLAALFGVWSSGGNPLCLPTALSEREIRSIAARCDIHAAIVSGGNPAEFSVQAICVEEFEPALNPEPIDGRCLLDGLLGTRAPGSLALLLVTSGTTDEPKIVELTASALLFRLAENLRVFGSDTLGHTLCTLPLHFGHGLIGNCLSTIYANGSLTIAADPMRAAVQFFEILQETGVTFLSSVPSFWSMAARTARGGVRAPHRLRVAGSGSAPLNSRIVSDFYEMLPETRLLNLYGLTEMSNWVAGAVISADRGEVGAVGRCWGGRAAVFREDGTIRPTGSGEIVLRSRAQMRRYRAAPESTRLALERGWLRTGDFGEISAGGSIVLGGRLVDQINRAGLKLSPVAIENVLVEHTDVEQVCCFGLDDELRGERVAAAVVRVPGSRVTGTELRMWLRGRLRSDALPESWFFLEDLPRSARGKVLRADLRRRFAER